LKLLMIKCNGELKQLLDHIQESEFENFAEDLVESPPDGLTEDELKILEDGNSYPDEDEDADCGDAAREATGKILRRLSADPGMDHAWAVAHRLSQALERGGQIDFGALLEARASEVKFCEENEASEGSYDYDAARGSFQDDVAQAADFVVEQVLEIAKATKR